MNAPIENAPRPSRGARLRWPMIVVGLLTAHVSAMALAVHVAKGAPDSGNGNRVLPDYYERAVRWDEERRAAEATDDLGWTVLPSVSTFVAEDGSRELTVSVTDDAGMPVDGLELSAAVWHHALGEAQDIELSAVTGVSGLYSTRAPMGRSGAWEIELSDRAADGVLARTFTIDVASIAGR